MISRRRRFCESLALLALPFALYGCLFEAPEVPTIENEWLVPLGNHQYSLGSILDADGFSPNSDGTLGYSAGGQTLPVSLGQGLAMDLAEDNLAANIGNVALEGLVSQDERVSLEALYGPSAAWMGTTTAIPPFEFDWAVALSRLPALEEAHIVSGTVDLYVNSSLPFEIGGADPSTQILCELRDASGGLLSSSVLTTPIAAQGSAYITLDLAGVTLAPGMVLQLHGGSGGSANALYVDQSAMLDLSVLPRTTIIDRAVAPIAAQSFGANVFVDLTETATVHSAIIESGLLQFEIESELQIPTNLNVSFDNVVDASGNPASLSFSLDPLASTTQQLDLGGYRVDGGGSALTRFDLSVSGDSPGSAGNAVVFDAAQSIRVRALPAQLIFAEIESAFGPEVTDLEPINFSLADMTSGDGAALTQADLLVRVFSDAVVPMELNLTLSGTLADGSSIQYNASANSAQSPGTEGSLMELHVDEADADFLAFLNARPQEVQIAGQATLGDGSSVSTVHGSDEIWADYQVTVPLTIELDGSSILLEPSSLNMSDSDRDALAGRLVAAELQIRTRSSLPVGADIYIGIDSDPAMVHDAPDVLLGPIELADPAPGSDEAWTEATSRVVMTQEQIDAILAGPVYMGGRLDMSRARGQVVSIRADHRIELGGFVLATLNVGSE